MELPATNTAANQMPQGIPLPPPVLPQDAMMGSAAPIPEQPSENTLIVKAMQSANLADGMDADELQKISDFVLTGYENDLKSREEWEKQVETWLKLALQVQKEKTFPWPKASNVKYPLLATAAMQFSARSYPSLVPSDGKLVKGKVIGSDPQGEKAKKASRIERHMSYQLLHQISDWEEEMDKLLIMLPIMGFCFKKTYWDSNKGRICSKLVSPMDLVVNYWSKSLEDCERKTEVIEMSPRLVKERQLLKIFRDVKLGPVVTESQKETTSHDVKAPELDETAPRILLEQHTFYDMDGDDYPEPYIITVDKHSKQVLRIVARFSAKDVELTSKSKIARITPMEFYTKFSFVPNPDGSFYDIGFGLLLGSINDSIDTLINQLVDAGTINNLQAGFISKGVRIKMGEIGFKPGEWKTVNSTSDDLRKGVLPLPTKEPSQALFNLLGMLIQSGKELASIADIFVGKMPGQNTPAYTTKATIEEGMKVFTAIFKRVFRSLTSEYKKIYKLNSIYLDDQEEVVVLDEPIQKKDYTEGDYDVCPAADPAAATLLEKQLKAQSLLELLPIGTLNPMAVTMRILEAQEQPAPEQLINQQPPQPDPKVQFEQMKAQMEQMKAQQKVEIDKMLAQIKQASGIQKMELERQLAQQKLEFKKMEHALDIRSRMESAQADAAANQIRLGQEVRGKAVASAVDLEMGVDKHRQSMAHKQEEMALKKKSQASKPKVKAKK